jgi:hypothetical protein
MIMLAGGSASLFLHKLYAKKKGITHHTHRLLPVSALPTFWPATGGPLLGTYSCGRNIFAPMNELNWEGEERDR